MNVTVCAFREEAMRFVCMYVPLAKPQLSYMINIAAAAGDIMVLVEYCCAIGRYVLVRM